MSGRGTISQTHQFTTPAGDRIYVTVTVDSQMAPLRHADVEAVSVLVDAVERYGAIVGTPLSEREVTGR